MINGRNRKGSKSLKRSTMQFCDVIINHNVQVLANYCLFHQNSEWYKIFLDTLRFAKVGQLNIAILTLNKNRVRPINIRIYKLLQHKWHVFISSMSVYIKKLRTRVCQSWHSGLLQLISYHTTFHFTASTHTIT